MASSHLRAQRYFIKTTGLSRQYCWYIKAMNCAHPHINAMYDISQGLANCIKQTAFVPIFLGLWAQFLISKSPLWEENAKCAYYQNTSKILIFASRMPQSHLHSHLCQLLQCSVWTISLKWKDLDPLFHSITSIDLNKSCFFPLSKVVYLPQNAFKQLLKRFSWSDWSQARIT